MTDLADLVSGMVADVSKGKYKKKRKPNILTDKVGRQPGLQSAVNPWTDEALVMVMYSLRCDNCGNESTSWEPALYIERHNKRRAAPITLLERLGACQYSSVYGGLPKRIEVIQKTSCTCPLCFGIGDSNHDELVAEVNPKQLHLFEEQ